MIIQEKIDQPLENKHPALLDDIIGATKGPKQKHIEEFMESYQKRKLWAIDSAKANPNFLKPK